MLEQGESSIGEKKCGSDCVDKDRNGTLEADDLSRVCKELGEDMTEEDIREVITRMDVDGDGAVGLDDFYAVITKKTFE